MSEERGRVDERVLRVATRLFAELGYDQITERMIAEAAGVHRTDIAGDKRDLYRQVIAEAAASESAVLEEAARDFRPDDEGVKFVLDGYLDFYIEHPENAALWMQRRMHDAADLADIEQAYTEPQLQVTIDLISRAARIQVDAELLAWTIASLVHTFVQGGIPSGNGERWAPEDRKRLARFRSHLHQMTLRMLGLDPATPPTAYGITRPRALSAT